MRRPLITVILFFRLGGLGYLSPPVAVLGIIIKLFYAGSLS